MVSGVVWCGVVSGAGKERTAIYTTSYDSVIVAPGISCSGCGSGPLNTRSSKLPPSPSVSRFPQLSTTFHRFPQHSTTRLSVRPSPTTAAKDSRIHPNHHPPPVAKDSNTENMMTKDGMTEVFAAVDAIAALSVKSGGKTYTCVA